LLIFQLAGLAEFADPRGFGSFDLQTRHSKLASSNPAFIRREALIPQSAVC
jgi:hypothetical protein